MIITTSYKHYKKLKAKGVSVKLASKAELNNRNPTKQKRQTPSTTVITTSYKHYKELKAKGVSVKLATKAELNNRN